MPLTPDQRESADGHRWRMLAARVGHIDVTVLLRAEIDPDEEA